MENIETIKVGTNNILGQIKLNKEKEWFNQECKKKRN